MSDRGRRKTFLTTITASLRMASSPEEEVAEAMAGLNVAGGGAVEDLVTRLAAELEKVGGRLHLAATMGEAREVVLNLVRERGVQRAVLCGGAELAEIGLEAALRGAGITVAGPDQEAETLRQAMIQADLGISGADCAIAETGTLVLVAGPDVPRNATALPPIHVAVMLSERIVPNLETAMSLLQRRLLSPDGTWGSSCITFITGPSRTADIEQSLTIGVHGPGEVHLVIVGPYRHRSASALP